MTTKRLSQWLPSTEGMHRFLPLLIHIIFVTCVFLVPKIAFTDDTVPDIRTVPPSAPLFPSIHERSLATSTSNDDKPVGALPSRFSISKNEPILFVTNGFHTIEKQCFEREITECVISMATEETKLIKNVWKRDFSLIFLTSAQLAHGDIEAAVHSTSGIKHSELQASALMKIANYHINNQHFSIGRELVSEVLSRIKDDRFQPYIKAWIFALTGHSLAKMDMLSKAKVSIDTALSLTTKIKEKNTRAEIYALISMAQMELGNSQGAFDSISTALTYARETGDPYLRALALVHIGSSLTFFGQKQHATKIFKRAFEIALTLRTKPRALTLSFIASKQAMSPNNRNVNETLRHAISAIEKVDTSYPLAPALSFIGHALANLSTRNSESKFADQNFYAVNWEAGTQRFPKTAKILHGQPLMLQRGRNEHPWVQCLIARKAFDPH